MASKRRYVADFETDVWSEVSTRVWAWCIVNIDDLNDIQYGNDIEDFILYLEHIHGSIVYFHNLKFDSSFIITYLLEHGYTFKADKKEITEDRSFTALISEFNEFYSLEIYFQIRKKNKIKITIYDSLKIINTPVAKIPKNFNIQEEKLEIDYREKREIGHKLTVQEVEYIKHDVIIVAKALKYYIDKGLTKMTIGSNALGNYKDTIGVSRFNNLFPKVELEDYLNMRGAYKGGFTYLNPIYDSISVGEGEVLDVNSLYPSVMYNDLLPFGEGVRFEDKYVYDKIRPLYIQVLTCSFELKEGMMPTIQIKGSRFIENEYLASSDGDIVTLTLSNIDLDLFFEHYNVSEISYHGGYKFKCMEGMFKSYIDTWIEEKNRGTIEGIKGIRQVAKSMLNSLYGKFASSKSRASKSVTLTDEGVLEFTLNEAKEVDGLYLPMGIFITAYARNKTIRTSQAIKDYSIKTYGKDLYIYSDTDSIHTLLPYEDLKKFCEIDDVKLGAWKHESHFTRARFLRQKTYIEEIDGKLNIKASGLTDKLYDKVTWDNFYKGLTLPGNLKFKYVKGGAILVDSPFTIKYSKIVKDFKVFQIDETKISTLHN